MKINDKNSALHLLIEGASGKLEIIQDATEFPMAVYFMNHEFPAMRDRFRECIQFLCKPFFDAYLKAREKLLEALEKEPLQKSGTLMYSVEGGIILTTFYDLKSKSNGEEMVVNGRIVIFANHIHNPLPRLTFYTHIKDNMGTTYQTLDTYLGGMKPMYIMNDVMSLLLFIKYCPVETKIVAKGKKVTHSNEDYFNKTRLPIEIIDSTWFTTIVRGEGFGVTGHFRLQPVGPGRSERKLIWIAAYEKKGYVRKAKVLRSKDRSADELEDDSDAGIPG